MAVSGLKGGVANNAGRLPEGVQTEQDRAVGQQGGASDGGRVERVQKARQAYGAAAASQASRGPAAEVSISPRAKEMALASRVVRDTPDVREDKVERLRQMVQNGEYKVDAGQIADSMVREAMKDEISRRPEVVLED